MVLQAKLGQPQQLQIHKGEQASFSLSWESFLRAETNSDFVCVKSSTPKSAQGINENIKKMSDNIVLVHFTEAKLQLKL